MVIEHIIEDCQCEGKLCGGCETVRCIGAFFKRADHTIGYRSNCKECMATYTREWKQAHRQNPKPHNRNKIPPFSHVSVDCRCEGKRCKACEKTKCIDNFYQDKKNKDGHTFECKVCCGKSTRQWKEANKDRVKASADWYTKKSEQKHRRYHLKKVYGLTEAQYIEMKDRQNGACAICGIISQKPLHIDHDHSTGKVRALLCTRCNSMLGYARDSAEMLKKGIEYLENYSKGEYHDL